MSGDTLCCHEWRVGYCWHLVSRDQDAAQHATMHMTVPVTKNSLAPDVNSAQAVSPAPDFSAAPPAFSTLSASPSLGFPSTDYSAPLSFAALSPLCLLTLCSVIRSILLCPLPWELCRSPSTAMTLTRMTLRLLQL